ncbi:MAG: N-acetyltransferase family protein [Actinomycetia bacterium]|nr:N-acetyltransferase family protein [Actinomycetes bacterium]
MSGWSGVVRSATRDDVVSINTIYNSYIIDSHVSFDTDPWSIDDRLAWFDQHTRDGFPILVAEDDEVIGAAWAGPWRHKPAYQRSVETTIILAGGSHGAGVGTRLYGALIDELVSRGIHRCYAIVALPNDVSIALHHKLGFGTIGTLDEVGYKDGTYISTMLLELRLDS